MGLTRGGNGKGKPDNNTTTGQGMEIHPCGGNTPADVIVLKAWGDKACENLLSFFKMPEKIIVLKVYMKENNEKTSAWVSYRHYLSLFGVTD